MDEKTFGLFIEALRALNTVRGFSYPNDKGERVRSYDLAAQIEQHLRDNGVNPYGKRES